MRLVVTGRFPQADDQKEADVRMRLDQARLRGRRSAAEDYVMSVLRMQQVLVATGLSRMTIYRLEKSGCFPSRLQLSANAIGWRKEDVEAWINSRPGASTSATTRGRSP